jgi:hypothetical protein
VTLRCEDIQAQAAGLASLRANDPERRAAEAHARTCPACAEALAEGAAVLDMVDRVLPLEAPRAEALARARREILAEIAPASGPASVPGVHGGGRSAPAAIAAVMASLAAMWLLPMVKHLGRGDLTLGSAAWALAAAAAAAAALVWGARVLFALPAIGLTLAVLDGGGGGLQASMGMKCAGLELGLAALPLVLTYVLARRGLLAVPIVAVAAAAGAGALVGQAVLHAACHAVPGTAHNLVFHLLPVLLALALGAFAGRSASARRAAATPPTSPG